MLKSFLKDLRESLFPLDYTCDLCGVETFGTNLCPDCAKTVILNDKATCPVCGRRTVHSEICVECKASLPRFKRAVSPLVYADGGEKLVKKFKDGNAYLKEYFATLIAEKLNGLPKPDCIVCVPATAKTVRERGYNQSLLLAKAISSKISAPVIRDAVIKVRDTSSQKSLSRKEREANLYGAFKVKKHSELKGKTVLLVDDILTTGSTANELTRVILNAGAKEVYLATAASVEYEPKLTVNEILTKIPF
ncbi:MAG: ComF family protein [Clostridia bacterium]|nr:ComF family protein [Clostridia bacterium]